MSLFKDFHQKKLEGSNLSVFGDLISLSLQGVSEPIEVEAIIDQEEILILKEDANVVDTRTVVSIFIDGLPRKPRSGDSYTINGKGYTLNELIAEDFAEVRYTIKEGVISG